MTAARLVSRLLTKCPTLHLPFPTKGPTLGSLAEQAGAWRVRGMRSSGCGGLFFTILKQRWDFYRFSPSLRRAVLLPFYVKSAELLHYPHPTPGDPRRPARGGARAARGAHAC